MDGSPQATRPPHGTCRATSCSPLVGDGHSDAATWAARLRGVAPPSRSPRVTRTRAFLPWVFLPSEAPVDPSRQAEACFQPCSAARPGTAGIQGPKPLNSRHSNPCSAPALDPVTHPRRDQRLRLGHDDVAAARVPQSPLQRQGASRPRSGEVCSGRCGTCSVTRRSRGPSASMGFSTSKI
jgi:hypothetical protein